MHIISWNSSKIKLIAKEDKIGNMDGKWCNKAEKYGKTSFKTGNSRGTR